MIVLKIVGNCGPHWTLTNAEKLEFNSIVLHDKNSWSGMNNNVVNILTLKTLQSPNHFKETISISTGRATAGGKHVDDEAEASRPLQPIPTLCHD